MGGSLTVYVSWNGGGGPKLFFMTTNTYVFLSPLTDKQVGIKLCGHLFLLSRYKLPLAVQQNTNKNSSTHYSFTNFTSGLSTAINWSANYNLLTDICKLKNKYLFHLSQDSSFCEVGLYSIRPWSADFNFSGDKMKRIPTEK